MRKLWIRFLLLALLTFAGTANADTVALSNITGGFLATSGSDQLYGWIFQVASPVTVTSLGVFDNGSDGLAISHDVGIYRQSDQALLGSTTVPSGTAGTLIDGFRYESVSPFGLAADTYVIVMTMPVDNPDTQWIEVSSFATASGITWVTSAFDEGSSLHFPNPGNNGAFAPGMFGPNFTFTAVPEPSTLSALGMGVGTLLTLVRRRRV